MNEYIISEPFTVKVTKTSYALDFAMDRYVLTKVCEYGEKLELERITRCRDCACFIEERGCCDYRKPFMFTVDPSGFCDNAKEKK